MPNNIQTSSSYYSFYDSADDTEEDDFIEPILNPDNECDNAGLIRYPELQEMFEKTFDNIWSHEAINYNQDIDALDDLNKEENKHERDVILFVTAFFIKADGIILKNLNTSFMKQIVCKEAQRFYAVQNLIELVHERTYFELAKALCLNEKDMNYIVELSRIEGNAIYDKIQWIKKWTDEKLPFPVRILAFACIEGILFNSSFIVYLWASNPVRNEGGYGRKHPLIFLRQATEWIQRDERDHSVFSILIYLNLIRRISRKEEEEIFRSAVELEMKFCKEYLCFEGTEKSKISSLPYKEVCQEIKLRANEYFSIIHPKENLYNVISSNLNFIRNTSTDTNPLETTSSDYKPAFSINLPDDDFFNKLGKYDDDEWDDYEWDD